MPTKVAADLLPNLGQQRSQSNHPLELDQVASFAPSLVIDVLLALLLIAAGNLQMPIVLRANPDIRPRRRNHQQLDPAKLPPLTHLAAGTIHIDKPAALVTAIASGLIVRNVIKFCRFGQFPGFNSVVRRHHWATPRSSQEK